MRSDWVGCDDLGHVLAALMPENRLVMEVALHTGLRVGDVLALEAGSLAARMTVREAKTGKSRRISISKPLLARLRAVCGQQWVFPGARDPGRHRTRQAVWADVKRAAKAFRLPANVTPHSARKIYAVEQFKRSGSIETVQRLLNHDDAAVTLIYAMADELSRRRLAAGDLRQPRRR